MKRSTSHSHTRAFVAKIASVIAVVAMGPLAVGVAYADDPASTAADSGTSATAPAAADGTSYSASDASSLAAALTCGDSAESRTVTVTNDITVNADDLSNGSKNIKCPITIVSDGQSMHTITWTGTGSMLWPQKGSGSLTIGVQGVDSDKGGNMLTFTHPKDDHVYGPLMHSYGTVTIHGGTFTGLKADRGTVVLNEGELTINGGKFSDNTAENGGVIYQASGSATINGGKFSDNTAENGGVIYQASGSATINGGTFSDNKSTGSDGKDNSATSGGGVWYGTGGASLTITGGTFEDNKAENGGNGGVIHSYGTGKITISGVADKRVVFKNNVQDAGDCSLTSYAACDTQRNGGGVVYMNEDDARNQGVLTVRGNVLFDGNGEKSSGLYSGGGAIWARGTLYIKNGVDGSKPVFQNNWAMIRRPSGDAKEQIERGGAGGAVFLMMRSTATITGGTYEGNTSGYLGGAIYTEESTTTYVGKTVAFGNTAGHFGGGLWFCPSGNSTASKGGNIALFGNSVNPDLDANEANKPKENGTEVTYAGSDLSIMNPQAKTLGDNQFLLLNTWFTDRNEDAVTWHWDNTPLKESSGFKDSWMGGKRSQSVLASTTLHPSTEVQKEGLITLTKDATPGAYQTGVAFKATVNGSESQANALKENAKKTAQITIDGNRSRMSGGGFGSNGVVVFDTPYSMSWQKVDLSADPVVPVKTSSTWTLSVTLGKDDQDKWLTPYNDDDMRPTDCQATSSTDADCWKVASTTEDSQTWTVDIVDNGRRDNDPDMGGISLDNLAPGTYTLTEKTAPNGYQKTENEYTFTIVAVTSDSKEIPKEPNLEYAPGSPKTDSKGNPDNNLSGDASQNAKRIIGNKLVEGKLEWTKTDDRNNPIAGSQWTLTGPNGLKYENVTDCTKSGTCSSDAGADTNDAEGKFALDIKLTNADGSWVFPDGNYTLTETQAPDKYWKTDRTYTFTLGTDASGNRTVAWNDGVTGEFANKPTRFAWSKVDKDSAATLLGGSEWTITQLEDASGKAVSGKSWAVVDCQPGSCITPQNGLADTDTTKGGLAVEKLLPGKYQLSETKAPDGYAKTDKTFDFTIGTTEKDSSLTLSGSDLVTGNGAPANAIGNARMISVLPFTGGWSARSWLIAGGALAGAAALVTAIVAEYRRRKAAIM
ncbi:SpaA isopeptide-forming pilin-related protein [Bifidobacterium callimiconis]|nr:SpaA isopeptide-forming pilin-related protein [Bifidobacterium callimiconis]